MSALLCVQLYRHLTTHGDLQDGAEKEKKGKEKSMPLGGITGASVPRSSPIELIVDIWEMLLTLHL